MKEHLNRMYLGGELSVTGIMNAVAQKWITAEAAAEIVGEENALPVLKAAKVAESKSGLAAYLASHPLTWIDGNKYTVTADKQSLLTSQLALYQTAMTAGQPYELKWNPTGGECSVWEYENLVALALAIGQYVQPLVSYQQAKEVEIMGAESVEVLEAIVVDYDAVASIA